MKNHLICVLLLFTMAINNCYADIHFGFSRKGPKVSRIVILQAILSQCLINKYGFEWYYDVVVMKNKRMLPTFVTLEFAEDNTLVINLALNKNYDCDADRWMNEVREFVDSLANADFTFVTQPFCEDLDAPRDVEFGQQINLYMLENFNSLNFEPQFKDVTYKITQTLNHDSIQEALFTIPARFDTFYYLKHEEKYIEECERLGLRPILRKRDADYSQEEKNLLFKYIQQDNEYYINTPLPEDFVELPWSYKAPQPFDDVIIIKDCVE